MDKICSFIKSQWKNVLIVILFVCFIFNVFSLNIITFCDKHEGFVSAGIGLVTVIIAYIALQSWKNELKAKKEYTVYKDVYKFLLSLREKIQYIKKYYKEVGDDDEIENKINNEMGQYFEQNLGLIQSLKLDLMELNDTNDIIQYFLEKFKKYSAKISDRPGWGVQSVWDSEGNVLEIDPYEENFYYDFFCTNDDDTRKELYIEFPKKIDEGLAYFEQEIRNFFK